jgi:putative hydrolase of the HAD superfamily
MYQEAILFDLDDTLYDRSQAFEKFVELFVSNYSSALDQESPSILKDTLFKLDCKGYKPRREMFTEIMNNVSWRYLPSLEELINYYCIEFPNCVESTSELFKTLDWCFDNNIKMGIVTNGPVQMQNEKIDNLKIRKYMRTIIISDEVGFRKPDPEIFLLALNELNIENNSALYIGDNPSTDIKGANDAGITSVWLSLGQTWDIEDYYPVITISSLSEIISHIKNY